MDGGERRVYGRRSAMHRRRVRRRRRVAVAVVLLLALVAGRLSYLSFSGGSGSPADVAVKTRATSPVTSSKTSPASSAISTAATPPPQTTVTIAAVGDTMLGNTTMLPPDPDDYFSSVSSLLRDHAQIVFGNLEGTLTTVTGSKCGSDTTNCYAFRAPPAYAADLRDAGFTVLNNANNHSYDFGAEGQEQTVSALHAAGIAQTGLPGEITVARVRGVRVAFVAFAPYSEPPTCSTCPPRGR